MKYFLAAILVSVFSPISFAQGEDSTKYERDEMIISEFLPGIYSNYNQVYFNNRGKVPDEERHLRREIQVQEIETNIFSVKDTFVMANIFEKPITEDDKKTSHAIINVEANNKDSFWRGANTSAFEFDHCVWVGLTNDQTTLGKFSIESKHSGFWRSGDETQKQ